MSPCTATVDSVAELDCAHAFTQIATIDLPQAFVGYGPLPAVTGIADGAAAWQSVGQHRTLMLADGSTAREELTEFTVPRAYAYRVTDYSSVLRFVVNHAQARWEFEPIGKQQCRIRWHYAYYPRNWLAAPLVWIIVRTLWTAYMRRSLRLCVQLAEQSTTNGDSR